MLLVVGVTVDVCMMCGEAEMGLPQVLCVRRTQLLDQGCLLG